MKNKIFMVVAVVVLAAIAGGATAYSVVKALQNNENQTQTTPAIVDSTFDGAGKHFTSYTAQGYPDLTYAAENAVKAVVGVIKTEEIPQIDYGSWGRNPFFDFFGIPQQQQRGERGDDNESEGRERGGIRYREQETGGGSGVIISPDGYIVTNHHVVVNASKLTVKMPDGKTYEARLIGTDADTEVALIKIEATDLPSIPFGSSDALRLGEWVLAIGNPYELHSTVTAGIVSAKGRSLGAIQTSGRTGIESFIQTDAAVNPGNSGGALVNTAGELVGINTLIISRTGSYAGYSFAVPETIVRKVVADLREYGVVQRALIGIEYSVIDERFVKAQGEEVGIEEVGEGGIYVGGVPEGGAAHAAGIKPGDIITSIDGIAIRDAATLSGIIGQKRPGDTIKIVAKRDGKTKHFDLVLRNRAGKSELLPKNSFDAIKALGGELANVNLSNKEKKELGIRGGIQVVSVGYDGILARAKVRRGYIITHINGTTIDSVNDLYRITSKITTIEGVYPDGKEVTYSLVAEE